MNVSRVGVAATHKLENQTKVNKQSGLSPTASSYMAG